MPPDDKLKLQPHLVIREESDACALLCDPDRRLSFALNPVAVCLCRALDGSRTEADLVALVRRTFRGVPRTVAADTRAFLCLLRRHKLVVAPAARNAARRR